MDESIDQYRAPIASLETVETGLPFFVVGTTKFVVLFLSTFGLYQLYWWFRQWRQQRDVARVSATPVMRSIFSIFFAHVLFRNANSLAVSKGVQFGAAPGLLAGTYILASISQNMLLRLNGIGPLLAATGVMLVECVVLTVAQRGINRACDDPQGTGNRHFSGANIVWIILGCAYVALLIVASVMPEA